MNTGTDLAKRREILEAARATMVVGVIGKSGPLDANA